jgi:hypothetical protein
MTEITRNIEGLRSLSEIYTPSNFKKIIEDGDLRPINNRIKKHLKPVKKLNYSNILKSIYEQLLVNYKSEYLYKNVLLNRLLLQKYSLNTTTILNEFRVGSSLADFILLNGEARVYEIKTDLDDLSKLEKQLNDYRQFANKIYVVTSSKHVNSLIKQYENTDIGIIEFSSQNTLRQVKEAEVNTANFNHTTIFKTLRKSEYLEIIKDYFGVIPDVPNTRIFNACLDLVKKIEIETFQYLSFNKLKERKLSCPHFLSSINTPFELKHICYTLDFKESEYRALYSFLKKEF